MDLYPEDCEDGICLWIAHIAKTKGMEAAKQAQKDPRIEGSPDLKMKIQLGLVQQCLREVI